MLVLSACDARSVSLSGLKSPVLSVQRLTGVEFHLSSPVDDGACDVLDEDVTATLNGVRLSPEEPGGPETSVKGALWGCSDVVYRPAELPDLPARFALDDRTAHFELDSATLAAPLALTIPDPVAKPGATLHLSVVPADDALDPSSPVRAYFRREGADDVPLAVQLDATSGKVTIPSDAATGPASLVVYGVCSAPAITCEGVTCRSTPACWDAPPLPVNVP